MNIKNLENNLTVAKKINPMAVVLIKSALSTLNNEIPSNLRDEIYKIKNEISKAKNQSEVTNLRAKWSVLNYFYENKIYS